jgi:hypothetical protein
MSRDLTELSDRISIIEVINHLFIGTDNRDWDRVRHCFAPNVLFDMSSLGAGPPKPMTPADITTAWDTGLKSLKAIHHQAGNHIVRILGKRAEAFCYGIAIHYLPNKTGANTRTFVGSYDFELEKDADHWTITKFRFNLKYIDGNPNLETS